MVDISHNVTRGGKTDIAGSVLVTPSSGSTGTGIVAADLTNGFAGVTVSFAANETVKPVTFGVVDDAAVEGTETYRLTMSNAQPSGSFPNGAFVEATLADNDTSTGPTVIYGPTTTGDSQRQDVGSVKQRMEHPYVNSRVAGTYMFGLDENGNGYALNQKSDNQYDLRTVTAYSVGDPLASGDASVLSGSQLTMNFADGDVLAVELINNRLFFYKNDGAAIGVTVNGYLLPTTVTATGARYLKHAGTTITNLQIIRLA